MNRFEPDDLGAVPMLDLFRAEVETQLSALTAGLLQLENGPAGANSLEPLMRAAHSLKGAARIISFQPIEHLAHAMEDCFDAASRARISFERPDIDLLLKALDLLPQLVKSCSDPEGAEKGEVGPLLEVLKDLRQLAAEKSLLVPAKKAEETKAASTNAGVLDLRRAETGERVLRLAAENLNRLLGLAGEALVEARWLKPFSDSLQQLKRRHTHLGEKLDRVRQMVAELSRTDRVRASFADVFAELAGAQEELADRLQELEMYDRRSANLSQRLYLEVLRTRMRPFSDGVRRFPRMVRDIARSLKKQVRIEITGESTQVDRDILERLETPLAHLIRNAVDHGCELPEVRLQQGKAAEALIAIEARHSAGALLVTVADDGAGVNMDELRQKLTAKGLVSSRHAESLGDSGLLECLLIPGFSLKDTVSEISGRGYGLDAVQNMVRQVRGSIRLFNQPGRGFRVQLQLPLTLSVLRALLVEISGEPYAIPLSQIRRALKLESSAISVLNGCPSFEYAGQQIRLASAAYLLNSAVEVPLNGDTCVVILGERNAQYGLIVDRFLGERELVVQALDPALGKIKNVNAAAVLNDGTPALIFNVEDLLHSMQEAIEPGLPPARLQHQPGTAGPKRVLVVDDSPALRQMEQRLLMSRGYRTEVAADGLEAWAALQGGHYDLVMTDIEMPRMDGIELARRIKQEPRLKRIPVLIVSYRDADEDRLRGLHAGADSYLAKSGFNEEALLEAVTGLIGGPGASIRETGDYA